MISFTCCIGIMQALNRGHVREFSPARKDPHWDGIMLALVNATSVYNRHCSRSRGRREFRDGRRRLRVKDHSWRGPPALWRRR